MARETIKPILDRRYDIDSLENRNPILIERLIKVIYPFLRRYHRAEVRGLDRIPAGPGLYVGNHGLGFMMPDTFIFCGALYDAFGIDAIPFGLGHEIAISLPLIHRLIVPLGAVRASHENGLRLLETGHKVLVYPGGDLDAFRPHRQRNEIVFGGRQGYIRLALRAGAPILPVVAAGAHSTAFIIDDLKGLARALRLETLLRVNVWPLTLSFPWGLTLGPPSFFFPFPSKIIIEALHPITFEHTGPKAAVDDNWVNTCARRVEDTMQAALTRLAWEREH
jgi:1-acyl-sn-glycerol-3-phosphate acyltransferase